MQGRLRATLEPRSFLGTPVARLAWTIAAQAATRLPKTKASRFAARLRQRLEPRALWWLQDRQGIVSLVLGLLAGLLPLPEPEARPRGGARTLWREAPPQPPPQIVIPRTISPLAP